MTLHDSAIERNQPGYWQHSRKNILKVLKTFDSHFLYHCRPYWRPSRQHFCLDHPKQLFKKIYSKVFCTPHIWRVPALFKSSLHIFEMAKYLLQHITVASLLFSQGIAIYFLYLSPIKLKYLICLLQPFGIWWPTLNSSFYIKCTSLGLDLLISSPDFTDSTVVSPQFQF